MWRAAPRCLLVAALLVVGAASQGDSVCPPEEEILPCRCTMHNDDLQIWCSHSDLPNVLVGLRAVASHLTRPIDELILENNNLPSLPGNLFGSLRVVRLMLRENGLERVAATWLTGLENSLLELFIVEQHLRTIPTDSLEQLAGLEAVTIQGGAMKRMPRFSGHSRLRYIQIQSPSLVELTPHGFKSLPDLEELHITMSPRLTRIEAGLLNDLPRLRLVNITRCGVSWLHPRSFSRLPQLTELSLVGNHLSDAGMIGRAIRDLPALVILRLNDNMIERLAEASFVDLQTIQEIHLADNGVTELQRGAFHLVPALRKLDLSNNRVRRIHPESFLQRSDSGLEDLWLVNNEITHIGELRALLETLPRLRYLDISHNYIEEIPFGALHGHPTLERLHLDHNRIQHVQREAFMAMPALRELRLRNNSLSTLMDGPMWNLPALKGLDLSLNVFRRIDARMLTNLPSLRRLDISGNALSTVDPDAFLSTPDLEHVNLSGNALIAFHPSTFQPLLGLYELDVGLNQLREVVPGLPRSVEYLRMPRNQITAIPTSPSPDLHLPSLKLLDLSGNGINRIPIGSLNSLSQLRTLNLGENAVQQLEDGSLNGVPLLEVLDLHDNRLLRIHGRALRDVRSLRELDLHGNRIETLQAELLQRASQLQRLDISRNQLAAIPQAALTNTRDLEAFDASRNGLTEFPVALHGLTKLHTLDLSYNRLKQLAPSILTSLVALSELRLAKNKFQELPEDIFRDLPNLTLLDLDSNELERISSRAVRNLPQLKAIRLSHNRLPNVPDDAFTLLPELLSAELQENQLTGLAGGAFKQVPHLVMLNLSHNQLEDMDQAGISGLKSLEVLDLSHNKMMRVGGASLAGMEAMVELKMDDNHICGIHGSPFTGMSRLRVLSLRNNKISALSEPAFQPLRNNVATLDIAGNPLSCSCGMLWLQTWLRETLDEGPQCADGSLLKEVRLSRQNCDARNHANLVAPGCEGEATHSLGTSQVISTWMEIKESTITPLVPPSPEESEYFYDEYVEYPLEEANATNNHSAFVQSTPAPLTTSVPFTNGVSSHYIPGDTPTLYAGVRHDKNKTAIIPTKQTPQPPRSGLTFFGIPLPSLNIPTLWGGAGRKADAKPGEVRFVGPRGKVQMLPPTPPKMQDGFQPMRPENGGFMPIVDPQLQQDSDQSRGAHITAERQLKYNYTSWNSNKNHTVKLPERPTYQQTAADIETARVPASGQSSFDIVPPTAGVNRLGLPKPSLNTITEDLSSQAFPTNYPEQKRDSFIKNKTRPTDTSTNPQTTTSNQQTTSTSTQSYIFDLIETDGQAPDPTFEPVDVAEANSIHDSTHTPKNITNSKNAWGSSWFGPPKSATTTTSSTTTTIKPDDEDEETTTVATSSLLGDLWGMISASGDKSIAKSPSSLSALLVPGGQQPQFKPPGGKPTITKINASPALNEGPVPMEEYLRRAQPSTNPRSVNDPPNYIPDTIKDSPKNESMEWYFQNYNKTNLKPYFGPGKRAANGEASRGHSEISTLTLLLMTCIPLVAIHAI